MGDTKEPKPDEATEAEQEGGELDEEELKKVAGGVGKWKLLTGPLSEQKGHEEHIEIESFSLGNVLPLPADPLRKK